MAFCQIGASYIIYVIGNKLRRATYPSDQQQSQAQPLSVVGHADLQCLRNFFTQIRNLVAPFIVVKAADASFTLNFT
jgi:hypothetical protein